MSETVTISIDGKEYEARKGQTVLEVALENGIDIPYFCFHQGLSIAGNCRMCTVEIEGAPKLSISCNERVRDGISVLTASERVIKARASILEFLLINHPLDCSVCDKSGECMLQDHTYDYRKFPTESTIDTRMELQKIVPTTKELSSKIWLWSNRCIHCSRCVRFCDEISGTSELTFVQRGAKAEIDCHPDLPIENNLSGNVVDLCPVGALLDKDFLYESRVWNLDKRDSICPHCSRGCNVTVESNRNEVKRLKPRHNPGVNDYWMCDHGRHDRSYFSVERVSQPEVRKGDTLQMVSRREALSTIIERIEELGGGLVAGLGSAQSTCEDNHGLYKLVTGMGGSTFAVSNTHIGEKEEFSNFVIDAEKAPNSSGALATMNLKALGTEALLEKINDGSIKALIAFGNDVKQTLSEAETETLRKLELLVVIDSWRSPLAELAHVLLPASIYAEKEGTFVNSDGRVQHLSQAVIPEASQAVSEWIWCKRIADESGASWETKSASTMFDDLAVNNSRFSGVSYKTIGDQGQLLAGSSQLVK
jgi:NADH-quinone oxidoreductase subunit G